MKRRLFRRTTGRRRRGAVTVEYLLLVTIVGIGVIVGLATVRDAMVAELEDIAAAIAQIVVP
jgi:pilus assembly protein Flp/PilA